MTIKIIANSPDLPKDYSITIPHAEERDDAIQFIRMCFVDMANAAGIGRFAYDLDEVFASVMFYNSFSLEDCGGSIMIEKIED